MYCSHPNIKILSFADSGPESNNRNFSSEIELMIRRHSSTKSITFNYRTTQTQVGLPIRKSNQKLKLSGVAPFVALLITSDSLGKINLCQIRVVHSPNSMGPNSKTSSRPEKHRKLKAKKCARLWWWWWWYNPTPSEGWGRGGTPRRPNSRATPQGLDHRLRIEREEPKIDLRRGLEEDSR